MSALEPHGRSSGGFCVGSSQVDQVSAVQDLHRARTNHIQVFGGRASFVEDRGALREELDEDRRSCDPFQAVPVQGVEGGVDTSHSSFLHRRVVGDKPYGRTEGMRQRSTAPRLEVLTTDYGFTYAGIRRSVHESCP